MEDSFVAFCLDRAVYTFGQRLEQELESAENQKGKSARQKSMAKSMILNRWLGIQAFKGVGSQKRR